MSRPPLSGATTVAGVVGSPIRHSLSPLIHNAWLEAAGIDGVYIPLEVGALDFARFVEGLRGTSIAGLNVTLPFKQAALSAAGEAHPRARRARAANLLTFDEYGEVHADNTDGLGLLAAFAEQAPAFDPAAGPVAILGAGGAARGAAGALLDAGCTDIRIVNRTFSRAEALAAELGLSAFDTRDTKAALAGVGAVINATSASLLGESAAAPLEAAPMTAVAMDMVYKPLVTPFLAHALTLGMQTVDGLAMLIGQARPSFEAFYGRPPPSDVDVRTLALEALRQ
jgi:shikimate dehydrogenase